MSQHVLEWLPAYHDGELPDSRLQQVVKHLQDCPACRAELQILEGLSRLLQAEPTPQYTPPERFAAQVQLRLPRSHVSDPHQNTERLPRWVLGIPLAIIVVWAFLQASLWLTPFVLTADWIIKPAPFASGLAENNWLGVFVVLPALNIVLLAGAVIFWAAWMAFWWVWKQNQNNQTTLQHLEKEY